jgi:hypothetical protein
MYAEDDPHIDKDISEETATLMGVREDAKIIISDNKENEKALSKVSEWWTSGEPSKNAAVVFKAGLGGHYLQKYQANFIASCVKIMVNK